MLGKLQRFRQRYVSRIGITVIVLGWAAFIVGSQVDSVSDAFIESGAMQLLILTVLLELSISIGSAGRGAISVYGRDREVAQTLLEEVRGRSIPSADMLEFSGVAVESLIHTLAANGCRVRLLVKHPETVSPFQRRRIVANLEALFGRDYADRIEVRCYRFGASLRGRRLGDELINLGWYTPFIENGSLARYEVMGHDNALVTAVLGTAEGRHLERMFRQVFDDIWDATDTENAPEVVERLNR